MGSDAVIVIEGMPDHVNAAISRIADLENSWSRFIHDSEISRLNRSSSWVDVSEDTLMLMDRSIDANKITSGAFDPTVLTSLVALGYDTSRSEKPGRTRLSHTPRAGRSPGLAAVDIDREMSRVRLGRAVAFDPGGLGKGLAADIVASEAVASGACAAMVSIGGDVRIAGCAPPEWVIAVENPFDAEATIAELRLEHGAICTSSVAANTWTTDDGAAVHHLIDPATGSPILSSIVAATVVAGEAWIAEAMCKTAIRGDALHALSFLESAGVEGLLVDTDRFVWRTAGLEGFAT
ncbi:MAG: FAD:protein FMN transferase [Actinomycetia bacterium]|nr:FAD:protein FMN transferase [Actinomycetes bacterium]